MASYLLDCNHMSAVVRMVSPLRDRIHELRRTGNRFATCPPVLCELEAGIQQTQHPDANRRRLNQLLKNVRLQPLDTQTTRLFGAVFNELRQKGRVLSQVDMMLAALARQHNLTLLSTDRDFEALPDIGVENWMP